MKKTQRLASQNAFQARNWPIIIVGLILMLAGIILCVVPIFFWSLFGWWSVLMMITGVTSIVFPVLSIKHNNPSWILLDVILPF